VIFRVKNKKKIVFKPNNNKVLVEGPDPQGLWSLVLGDDGVEVDDGLVIKLKDNNTGNSNAKSTYKFHSNGLLKSVQAPALVLRNEVTNTSGDVFTRISIPVFPCGNDDAMLVLRDQLDDLINHVSPISPANNPAFTTDNLPLTTSVSPNPFTDILQIQITSNTSAELNIALFDQSGREVIKQLLTGTTGLNAVDLNTQTLSNGLYYLRIETENGVEIKKVVKQNVYSRP
jgi:hypothetical protein